MDGRIREGAGCAPPQPFKPCSSTQRPPPLTMGKRVLGKLAEGGLGNTEVDEALAFLEDLADEEEAGVRGCGVHGLQNLSSTQLVRGLSDEERGRDARGLAPGDKDPAERSEVGRLRRSSHSCTRRPRPPSMTNPRRDVRRCQEGA